MRSYNYSHGKDGFSISTSEGPWWSFILEDLVPDLIMDMCERIPDIKIVPDWLVFWDKEDKRFANVGAYYGDNLQDIWCYLACHKIGNTIMNIGCKHQIYRTVKLTEEQVNHLLINDPRFKQFYGRQLEDSE